MLSRALKDTHSGRGRDGSDGADGDGLLGVTQVPGPVGSRHDACAEEDVNIHHLPFYPWPTRRRPELGSPLRYL